VYIIPLLQGQVEFRDSSDFKLICRLNKLISQCTVHEFCVTSTSRFIFIKRDLSVSIPHCVATDSSSAMTTKNICYFYIFPNFHQIFNQPFEEDIIFFSR